LGSDFISIDSSSTLQLNKIKFHPYLAYETEKTRLQTQGGHPKMKAQDFITSLKVYLHFKGMEALELYDY
jgi:hypothetical protein